MGRNGEEKRRTTGYYGFNTGYYGLNTGCLGLATG